MGASKLGLANVSLDCCCEFKPAPEICFARVTPDMQTSTVVTPKADSVGSAEGTLADSVDQLVSWLRFQHTSVQLGEADSVDEGNGTFAPNMDLPLQPSPRALQLESEPCCAPASLALPRRP